MSAAAIVLAAGSGKRMNTAVKKQYLPILDMPVLAYSLLRFERQSFIDRIVLVTSAEEIAYCEEEIVWRYGIRKADAIIPGGKERSDSVYEGLKQCRDMDYVFIHDGARPFISDELLENLYRDVQAFGACIAAVPVKDTIKLADGDLNITHTPDRRLLWQAQTPQVFETGLILSAYERAIREHAPGLTDDASCVEYAKTCPVHLTMGSYENMKITTPEDLTLANVLGRKYKLKHC